MKGNYLSVGGFWFRLYPSNKVGEQIAFSHLRKTDGVLPYQCFDVGRDSRMREILSLC